jgi:hypothetical protein
MRTFDPLAKHRRSSQVWGCPPSPSRVQLHSPIKAPEAFLQQAGATTFSPPQSPCVKVSSAVICRFPPRLAAEGRSQGDECR